MSQGIESLLTRISQLVSRRWNVSLSFLSDSEANERYKFPFEETPSTALQLNIREPQEISVIPIYRHNLLMGAIQIPNNALAHDDILEISELTRIMINQSLLLQEELRGTEKTLNQLEMEQEEVFSYGPLRTRNKDLCKTWQVLDEHLDSMTPILICGEKGVGKKTLARTFITKQRLSFRRKHVIPAFSSSPAAKRRGDLRGQTPFSIWGQTPFRRDDNRQDDSKDVEIIILPVTDAISATKQEEMASFLFQQMLDPAKKPRVIALADFDYPTLARQSWLKQPLLKRLNQVVITLPPLRKSREDLFLLMDHRFKISSNYKLSVRDCTPQTISALSEYHWPGNVKELFDVIDSLVENCRGNRISADLLPPSIIGRGKMEALKKAKETKSLNEALTILERELIRESLQTGGWNKSLVSKRLGISRSNLIQKVEKYNLTH